MRSGLSFLLSFLVLAACDDAVPDLDTVTFDGVTYETLGGATLEPTDDGLVVGRGDNDTDDEYGVRVTLDALDEADFQVEPVDIPGGGRWGLQLFGDVDGDRVPIATAWAEGLDDDTHEINFDFDPAVGTSTITVEYYLDGALLYRVPRVPLNPEGAAGGARSRLITVGQGDGGPESVHVIRDGGKYIVATDYGGGEPRTVPGGCAGILLSVSLPGGPTEPFCTDYVQAIPDQFGSIEAVTGMEIRARAVEQFTLTGGDVEE